MRRASAAIPSRAAIERILSRCVSGGVQFLLIVPKNRGRTLLLVEALGGEAAELAAVGGRAVVLEEGADGIGLEIEGRALENTRDQLDVGTRQEDLVDARALPGIKALPSHRFIAEAARVEFVLRVLGE